MHGFCKVLRKAEISFELLLLYESEGVRIGYHISL